MLSVVLAVTAFALALLCYYEVSTFGFPDGHRTAYQRAVALPLQILMGLQVATGASFLWCAARPGTRGGRGQFVFTLGAFLVIILCTHAVVPWYYLRYLGLDHGRGG